MIQNLFKRIKDNFKHLRSRNDLDTLVPNIFVAIFFFFQKDFIEEISQMVNQRVRKKLRKESFIT